MSKFLRDTIITLSARFSELIIGIGASVIIARALGPEGRGVYALAILLPALLIIFTEFGNGAASIYNLGKKKYSSDKIFGINLIISTTVSLFALLAGVFISFFLAERLFPAVNPNYLLLALLIVPFSVFANSLAAMLQGLGMISKYNFNQVIKNVVYLISLTLIALLARLDISSTILVLALSHLVGMGLMLFQVFRSIGGISFRFDGAIIKDFFNYGSKVYLTNIVSFLHLRVDAFMINLFINPIAVGYYSISVALTEKLWLLSKSVSVVLFPKIASEKDPKKLKELTPKVVRNVIFMTTIMAVFLLAIGERAIIFLYSEEFLPSVAPLYILVLGSIAISASRALTNDLLGRGLTNVHLYANVVSVVLNVLLNLFLIPRHGIIGAAYATTFTYTVVLFLRLVIYNRVSGNKSLDSLIMKKEDFREWRVFLKKFTIRKGA